MALKTRCVRLTTFLLLGGHAAAAAVVAASPSGSGRAAASPRRAQGDVEYPCTTVLDFEVQESESPQEITVPRCVASGTAEVTMRVLFARGTASYGTDFLASSAFTIPAGATDAAFSLNIDDDGTPEPDEVFYLYFLEPNPPGPPCELLARVTIAGDLPSTTAEPGARRLHAGRCADEAAGAGGGCCEPAQCPKLRSPQRCGVASRGQPRCLPRCQPPCGPPRPCCSAPPCGTPPPACTTTPSPPCECPEPEFIEVAAVVQDGFVVAPIPRCFPGTDSILVNWGSIDGTATSGSDYYGGSVQDTLGPTDGGLLSAYALIYDAVPEPPEVFFIFMAQPPPADQPDALPCLSRARVTITNSDAIAGASDAPAASGQGSEQAASGQRSDGGQQGGGQAAALSDWRQRARRIGQQWQQPCGGEAGSGACLDEIRRCPPARFPSCHRPGVDVSAHVDLDVHVVKPHCCEQDGCAAVAAGSAGGEPAAVDEAARQP